MELVQRTLHRLADGYEPDPEGLDEDLGAHPFLVDEPADEGLAAPAGRRGRRDGRRGELGR